VSVLSVQQNKDTMSRRLFSPPDRELPASLVLDEGEHRFESRPCRELATPWL
jgi:hypothetical protein